MKSIFYLLSVLPVILGSAIAQEAPKGNAKDKDIIVDIPTDLPPTQEAEKVVPQHPFSLSSSTQELMEKIQELEGKIENLENRVSVLEKGKK
jgi:prefoldin subunit 5